MTQRAGTPAARHMAAVKTLCSLQSPERVRATCAAGAQVAYDESLLAVSVMFERPGFGWTRLLHRLADGQSFEDAIPNFGFSYADLEAPFAR